MQLADPDDIFSLITQTDTVTSNGRPYTNTYDAGLRQFTRRSPAGREMVSTIDELGRVRSVQLDPALAPVTYAYDVQGRPTEIAQGTQRWTYTYDALSRPITRTDAAENQLQFAYDDTDRLTQVTLASGRTYNYSYDVNGNVVQIIMPSNAVHDLGYTSLNLDAGYTPPDNASLSRSYNLDRQWTSTLLPSGRTVDSGYDSAGRPTGLSYPEAATSYTYADTTDRASELLRNPTGAGTAQSIGFSYEGNLVTEMIWSGGAQGIFTYTWDDNFFLAGLELASGADTVTVPFSRDLDGAITGNGPFAVTRDGPLRLPSGIGDGALAITYAYDSLGRVASRTHTVDGQEAYQVGFTYDNLGRIGQKIETIAGTTHTYDYDYAYDVDGQLTEVQRDGTVVEDYSYDLNGNGNRTSTFSATASYDTQDRLTELGGVTYTFDADGFLTQRGSDTFTYSARGELLSASVDGQTITYTYDGLSRRVGRTDTSGTHQYLYGNPGNPFQVTAVREPAGTLHHLLLRRGRTARAFSFSCLVGKAHHVESLAEMGIVAA